MVRLKLLKKVISRFEFYPIFKELDQDFKRSTYKKYVDTYKRKNTINSISELSSIKVALVDEIKTINQQWLDHIYNQIGNYNFIDDEGLNESIKEKLFEIASQEYISIMTQPVILHLDFFYDTDREVPDTAIKFIELIELQLLARFYGVLIGEISKYFNLIFGHDKLDFTFHSKDLHNKIVFREYHLQIISMILDHFYTGGNEPILSLEELTSKKPQSVLKRKVGRRPNKIYTKQKLVNEIKRLLDSKKFYHPKGPNKGLPNISAIVKKLERTTFQDVENPLSTRHLSNLVKDIVIELKKN